MRFSLLAIASLLGAAAPAIDPIFIVDAGNGHIELVGEADEPMSGRYRLEISDGSGNRSVQSGRFHLQAGERVRLLSARQGGAPITAHLSVDADDWRYERKWPSND